MSVDIPSLFTYSESDSVKLLGRGQLPAPASCFMCGSGNGDNGYVDLGTYIEYHGEALLCMECLLKVSEIAGCLPPEIKLLTEKIIAELSAANAELTKELEHVRSQLSVFNDAIARAIADAPKRADDVASKAITDLTPPIAPEVDAVQSDLADFKPEPTEPVKGNKSGSARRAPATNRSNPGINL